MANNSWDCIWCGLVFHGRAGPYVEGNLGEKEGLCEKCAKDIVEQVEERKRKEAEDGS